MQCRCGHTITVDTESKSDAIAQIKEIWSPSQVSKHMLEKHKGEDIPSQNRVFAMITQSTKAATA